MECKDVQHLIRKKITTSHKIRITIKYASIPLCAPMPLMQEDSSFHFFSSKAKWVLSSTICTKIVEKYKRPAFECTPRNFMMTIRLARQDQSRGTFEILKKFRTVMYKYLQRIVHIFLLIDTSFKCECHHYITSVLSDFYQMCISWYRNVCSVLKRVLLKRNEQGWI